MIRPLLFMLALTAGFAAHADGPVAPPTPSAQTYVLNRGMLTLGEAHFALTQGTEAGCWHYEYNAEPSGIAALFIGTLSEKSDFCLDGDQLRSRRFEFHRADRSKDDFTVDFDWKAGTSKTSRGVTLPLTDGMTDRLAMQIVIQRWVIARAGVPSEAELSVTKVEAKKAKTYRFRIVAREPVTVPAGKFDAVRVERVDNPEKVVRFWLAPARGYTAVRVEDLEDGDQQFAMELK